jgi:hypothetical protein
MLKIVPSFNKFFNSLIKQISMRIDREKQKESVEDLIHLERDEEETAKVLDLLRPVDALVTFKLLWFTKERDYFKGNDVYDFLNEYNMSERESMSTLNRLRRQGLVRLQVRKAEREMESYYKLEVTTTIDRMGLSFNWKKEMTEEEFWNAMKTQMKELRESRRINFMTGSCS